LKIIACYKIVPEEQDFLVDPDRGLSYARAEWKIGQYDLNAVEAGAQLAAATGGQLLVLSVGAAELENGKLRKGILSRGAEALGLVIAPELKDADPHQTACALAAAIRSWQPDCDLVLCGEGSADVYGQQVGQQLGELLGLPAFNAVSRITPQDGRIRIERRLEAEAEVLDLPLPAVLTVTTDINRPRIPGMKDILNAGKKPVAVLPLEIKAEQTLEVISTLAPKPTPRQCVLIEGDSADKVAELVGHLQKELGR
jgi:electron transfer flavoprotein beta subunit